MELRKLVKAGPSSHTVSLPKAWLVKNRLTKGNVVFLEERNNEIVITTQAKTPILLQEKTISIDEKQLGTIQRELASAYMNNYGKILLVGAIAEKAKSIRTTLQGFAGLEIVEEAENRLVVQDLLNVQELSPDKTLHRMDMILRAMLHDSAASLGSAALDEALAIREQDLNRLHMLLYRLLKGSLTQPSLAQHINLSASAVLSCIMLANDLKQSAAALAKACVACKKSSAEELAAAKSAFAFIDVLYRDVMAAFFEHDKMRADTTAQNCETAIANTAQLFSVPSAITAELAKEFEQIIECISRIAQGVIDRE